MEGFASFRIRRSHFASELRRRIQSCSSCIKRNRTLFGQGRVLSANKTARATFSRSSRDRLRELRAQRLRLIRALRTEFSLDNAIAMPMLWSVGELKHRLTVRLTDEHVAHLNNLANASGLKRNEVMRRLLLSEEIPSAEERRDIQQILRVQKEQNRLGGLLKKALTEREEKASLRRTLAEIERNAAELRRLIGHIRGVS